MGDKPYENVPLPPEVNSNEIHPEILDGELKIPENKGDEPTRADSPGHEQESVGSYLFGWFEKAVSVISNPFGEIESDTPKGEQAQADPIGEIPSEINESEAVEDAISSSINTIKESFSNNPIISHWKETFSKIQDAAINSFKSLIDFTENFDGEDIELNLELLANDILRSIEDEKNSSTIYTDEVKLKKDTLDKEIIGKYDECVKHINNILIYQKITEDIENISVEKGDDLINLPNNIHKSFEDMMELIYKPDTSLTILYQNIYKKMNYILYTYIDLLHYVFVEIMDFIGSFNTSGDNSDLIGSLNYDDAKYLTKLYVNQIMKYSGTLAAIVKCINEGENEIMNIYKSDHLDDANIEDNIKMIHNEYSEMLMNNLKIINSITNDYNYLVISKIEYKLYIKS